LCTGESCYIFILSSSTPDFVALLERIFMILMIAADASLSLLRVCNRNLTTKQGVYDFASEFGILPVSGSSPPGRQRQQQQQHHNNNNNNNNHLSSSFGFDIIDGACVFFVFRVSCSSSSSFLFFLFRGRRRSMSLFGGFRYYFRAREYRVVSLR